MSVATPVSLNERWLAAWLRNECDPQGSPYAGVARLMPGTELVSDAAGWRVVEFAGPTVWAARPSLAGEAAVRAIVDAVDCAVAELSAGESVIAVSMSGGLDSTFLASSLLRNKPAGATVRAYTHVPNPAADLREVGWVDSDEADAGRFVAEHEGELDWELVASAHRQPPLERARELTEVSWWPTFGVGNLEWTQAIRSRAAAEGATRVWVGGHGNASFSHDPGPVPSVRRRVARRAASLARRPRRPEPTGFSGMSSLIRGAAPAGPPTRATYLRWLAAQSNAHAAVANPDAVSVPSVDPFRHPAVLEVAAQITPEGWRQGGVPRGLARAAGRGRVPDAVRLRRGRGAQGADVWMGMSGERESYREQVELLRETTVVRDEVEIAKVRAIVDAWPWGSPVPPPRLEISAVNRLLAFAQFIRDTEERLAEINRAKRKA